MNNDFNAHLNDSSPQKGRLLFLILFGLFVFLYMLWWPLNIYFPYLDRKGLLQKEIGNLAQHRREREEELSKVKEAEDQFQKSMAHFNNIRAKLPLLQNFSDSMTEFKQRAGKYHLNIQEIHDTPSLDTFPSEAGIQIVNLKMKIRGDFISLGKFIQSLEEDKRPFCEIREVTIERYPESYSQVLAHLNMAIVFSTWPSSPSTHNEEKDVVPVALSSHSPGFKKQMERLRLLWEKTPFNLESLLTHEQSKKTSPAHTVDSQPGGSFPDIELTGIAFFDNQYVALINGINVREGEEIAGYKIKKIERDCVIMTDSSGKNCKVEF